MIQGNIHPHDGPRIYKPIPLPLSALLSGMGRFLRGGRGGGSCCCLFCLFRSFFGRFFFFSLFLSPSDQVVKSCLRGIGFLTISNAFLWNGNKTKKRGVKKKKNNFPLSIGHCTPKFPYCFATKKKKRRTGTET